MTATIGEERASNIPAADPVGGFLAQFPASSRAEALHLALQALRAWIEPERVLACELAWEVHARGYWSQLSRADGSAFESEEAYFREVLGLASWRTAYKRLAIGRMLHRMPERERAAVRAAVAAAGVAKVTIVVPAIERLGEWRLWLEAAAHLSASQLQAHVSEAQQALPRGRDLTAPGERFRRSVLAAMPDIDAMELVERFFEVGARVVGTENPVAIFLAGAGVAGGLGGARRGARADAGARRHGRGRDGGLGRRPSDPRGRRPRSPWGD